VCLNVERFYYFITEILYGVLNSKFQPSFAIREQIKNFWFINSFSQTGESHVSSELWQFCAPSTAVHRWIIFIRRRSSSFQDIKYSNVNSTGYSIIIFGVYYNIYWKIINREIAFYFKDILRDHRIEIAKKPVFETSNKRNLTFLIFSKTVIIKDIDRSNQFLIGTLECLESVFSLAHNVWNIGLLNSV
jgi:hypothetical protein